MGANLRNSAINGHETQAASVVDNTAARQCAELQLTLAKRHCAYAFDTIVWACAAGSGIFLAMFLGWVSAGAGQVGRVGVFAMQATAKIAFARASGDVCRALDVVGRHRALSRRETARVLARPFAVAAVAFDVAAAPLSCLPRALSAWASAAWLAAAAAGLVAAPVAWRRLCRRPSVAAPALMHWYDGARTELASLVAVSAIMCGQLLDYVLLMRAGL